MLTLFTRIAGIEALEPEVENPSLKSVFDCVGVVPLSLPSYALSAVSSASVRVLFPLR